MSELHGLRTLTGEVIEHIEVQFPGNVETRLVSRLPGQTWEIPLHWFRDAGYEPDDLEPGLSFKVEAYKTHGFPLRSLERIVPPIN